LNICSFLKRIHNHEVVSLSIPRSHRNIHHESGRLEVALTMADVEAYNQKIVLAGYSQSQVSERLQMIHALIERAGRPEFGHQLLDWNWDSRDVAHGKPTTEMQLLTLPQLKRLLGACELREQTLVWMGIGLGFGPSDLAAVRVGQIDKCTYDLRRGKTGIERFGDTPLLVWTLIRKYIKAAKRKDGELLFVTRTGKPIVHGRTNSVYQWWDELRTAIEESKESLGGFYMLRHLGATEYGSRAGTSIGQVKRWLGHSASSRVADQYMKPVSPEDKAVVEWVRNALARERVRLGE
jgi:integrase